MTVSASRSIVIAVEIEQLGALGRDHDELAVADELGLARVLEEGDDVGGEERLALAEPDHHRALQARADDHLRVQRRDDAEREVAVQVEERAPHGLDEVALVVRLEQVRDDLGVRLGAEDVALGDQPLLEHHVVLDDAVEHDREAVVAAGERMRVGLGGAAVGRPARVPDAGRGGRAVRARDLLQHAQVADGAHDLELVAVDQRDAGRVVAAVLEALESADQEGLADARPGIADDAAHGGTPQSRAADATDAEPNDPGTAAFRRCRAPAPPLRLAHWQCGAALFHPRARPSRARAARCRTSAARCGRSSRRRAARSRARRPPRRPCSRRRRVRSARTLMSTCGNLRTIVAASASGSWWRPSASSSSTAVIRPSPVVWRSSAITWPDCSPPSTARVLEHAREHVAVADVGHDGLDAELAHGAVEAEVRHRRHDDLVARQAARRSAGRARAGR